MANRDKLIDKIVKLFRLGDAQRSKTTEGELLSAVTKAKQLMADHNIDMVEVEGHLDEEKVRKLRIIIEENNPYTRKGKFATYDHTMMSAVSTLTETRVYLKNSWDGYQSVIFVGETTDVHIAGELYMVLLKSLRRFTREACGSGWSKQHTDYALGFGLRVTERAKAIVAAAKGPSADSLALVVRKKSDALDKFYDSLNLKKPKKRARDLGTDYFRGYADGDRMDLGHSRHINQGATPGTLKGGQR